MATTGEVGAVFKMVMTYYPYYLHQHGAKHCDKLLELWEVLLADTPIEHLQAACQEYLGGDYAFFPTAGKLRTMALSVSRPDHETALEAWGSVISLMQPGANWPGKYFAQDEDGNVLTWGGEPPRFANPITQRCVLALGGWETLGLSECGMSERSQFVKCYEQLMEREEVERKLLPETRRVRQEALDGMIGGLVKQLTGGER